MQNNELEKEPLYTSQEMSMGYIMSDRDVVGRGAYNKVNDRVVDQRLQATTDITVFNSYVDFKQITAPAAPDTRYVRLYTKTTGSDTGLFVKDSSSNEYELASTSNSVTDLDTAYDGGSTITADSTDLDINLSSGISFTINDDTDTTTYFSVNSSGVVVNDITLPSTDGTANQILTTNGSGATSFTSLSDIADSDYLRLDGGTVTGDVELTSTTTITKPVLDTDYIEIASGSIEATAALITIDTEALAATSSLNEITGGTEGQLLVLQSADDTRVITIQDAFSNILLTSGDFTLNSTLDKLVLIYSGSSWVEIVRTNNG